MNTVAIHPETLRQKAVAALGERVSDSKVERAEVTLTVAPEAYKEAMQLLRNAPGCQFEQLTDLCGVDYSTYKNRPWSGKRFCVVVHLLSVSLNQRIRVKVFCANDDAPILPSLMDIWSAANWYEREPFDMFGIVFEGHNDLRRILTDYNFDGHPLRKDFPLEGHVEMRYDEALQRVVYQPVTIEPREITPRIVREDNYGGLH